MCKIQLQVVVIKAYCKQSLYQLLFDAVILFSYFLTSGPAVCRYKLLLLENENMAFISHVKQNEYIIFIFFFIAFHPTDPSECYQWGL